MPFLYYGAHPFCELFMSLVTRRRVIGKNNVPTTGSMIVVANHLNNADPPILGLSVWPREMAFMAKEELFRNPLLRAILRGVGAFPVNRGRFDREALRKAREVLHSGTLLGLFPEGKRSKTGGMEEAMPGPALMARHFKSPILPVGIYGTEKAKGGFWFFQRPRVTISIGIPFDLPATGHASKDDLKNDTDFIMRKIAELIPEQYRGVYGNETRKAN